MLAILSGNPDFRMADIWQFALRNGTNLYYTNADIDLTVGGQTYVHGDVLCDGAKVSWETGLSVGQDEIDMKPNVGGTNPSMVGSIPFLQAIMDGLFDRAVVTRSRLFMSSWGNTTPGAITLFVGEVTDAKITQNTAIFTVKDMRNLLNIFMPSRQYAPTCPWVFGDSNCTFNRSSLTVNSSVIAGSNSFTVNCGLTNGAGYFNNGTIKFTSGLNNGISRSVKSWIIGMASLVAPFPNIPAVGDTFQITPGCTKNYAGPVASFNGSALGGSTNNSIVSGLSNTAGFFNGGTLQFTSGTNVGQTRTVSNWQNGIASISGSFPNTPNVGDEFVITSSSSNTQGSCTGFGNTAHFGGQRFIPVPETSY